ncbi:hypothetical protein QQ020_12830 [Fulvivirgaceae bacterium BMA12]|uniref:Zinc-finger domain-containing protein n=1 Tax=Agaribacillus aureus TaxID=3051825 RepID=A0ABT8L9L4_9BACT|nr:hypothetical protein [Fulvivirgaceae bacterium BMA12]
MKSYKMEHLTDEQISGLLYDPNKQNLEEINHLKVCESCQLRYNQALRMHEQLKSLEYKRPSMRFAKNIVEIIERNKKLDRTSLFWTRVISGGLLVAVSMALVMIVYWYTSSFEENNSYRLMINQWNLTFLAMAAGFWLLYFFDHWLGRKRRKQV